MMSCKIEEVAAILGVSYNTIRNDWVDAEQVNDRGDWVIPSETVKLLTWMKSKFYTTQMVTTGLRLMTEEDDTEQHVCQLMET